MCILHIRVHQGSERVETRIRGGPQGRRRMSLDCLLRREYNAARLLTEHPPVLRHPHKRLVFDLACPARAPHEGTIALTRWSPVPLPSKVGRADVPVAVTPGYYDYE